MRLAGVLNRRSEADDAAAGLGGAKDMSLCKSEAHVPMRLSFRNMPGAGRTLCGDTVNASVNRSATTGGYSPPTEPRTFKK